MAWKYKCDKCGATLDAGEHCTCDKDKPHRDEGRQQAHEEKINSQTRDLPIVR